ncbi:MAG: NADH-quinone oxidoreductase subunit N, partial [Chloroflexi bacterium]
MFDTPTLGELNLEYTLPALSLALGSIVLLVFDLFIPKGRKNITAGLAVIGVIVSFVLNLWLFNKNASAFQDMFVVDEFTGFINIVALLTALLSILLSIDYLKRADIEQGEFYPLLLMTTAGVMFMASANNLVVLFIALELLSIPLYVLAAFRYPELKSEESGMKYFILGAFASAFFVYGSALTYGATGTTDLRVIAGEVGAIAAGQSAEFLLLAGTGLLLVGLGFKIAVVPFHMWTPDVYEGAPTPVTAYMSVAAKVGGFAALLRIMAVALPGFVGAEEGIAMWQDVVWIVAAATLILSNIVAVAQTDIKRMLAYSSISHAGFILMAVAAAGTAAVKDIAVQAALIYLLTYMFGNIGAFGVALAVEKDDGTGTRLDDFVGLAKKQPALAFMMAVFMFSLTGIPLTAGFIGKWFVFRAALDANLIVLAVIA